MVDTTLVACSQAETASRDADVETAAAGALETAAHAAHALHAAHPAVTHVAYAAAVHASWQRFTTPTPDTVTV